MNFLQKSLLALGLLVGSLFVGGSALAQTELLGEYVFPCLTESEYEQDLVFESDSAFPPCMIGIFELNNVVPITSTPWAYNFGLTFENTQNSSLYEHQCRIYGGDVRKKMIILPHQIYIDNQLPSSRVFYDHLINKVGGRDAFFWDLNFFYNTPLQTISRNLLVPVLFYPDLSNNNIIVEVSRTVIDLTDIENRYSSLGIWQSIVLSLNPNNIIRNVIYLASLSVSIPFFSQSGFFLYESNSLNSIIDLFDLSLRVKLFYTCENLPIIQ